jgi:hypothetical protein
MTSVDKDPIKADPEDPEHKEKSCGCTTSPVALSKFLNLSLLAFHP